MIRQRAALGRGLVMTLAGSRRSGSSIGRSNLHISKDSYEISKVIFTRTICSENVPQKRGEYMTSLTSREQEIVLTLAAGGPSNKDVGRRLHVSEGTVKVHLHNIYRKLGVKNRTELVARAHTEMVALAHTELAAARPARVT
jgi:DNA-binding NarL/FixJ family response regulator